MQIWYDYFDGLKKIPVKMTPLMIASHFGHRNIIRILISHKADVDLPLQHKTKQNNQQNLKYTALCCALGAGNIKPYTHTHKTLKKINIKKKGQLLAAHLLCKYDTKTLNLDYFYLTQFINHICHSKNLSENIINILKDVRYTIDFRHKI